MFWDALILEALEDWTLLLVGALAVTLLLVGSFAPEERVRAKGYVVLTALHLALLPVLAGQRATDGEGYQAVRLVSLVFASLAAVGMAGALLFGVVLPRVRLRAPLILRDVVAAIAAIVGVIVLANRAGFPLSGLITTSAVLTAIIGFSLQDTLGNIMGGLALQLDRSIQVGDWIKLGDVNGRVTEIRWRYTAIETRNWETVLVANSAIAKSQVTVLGRRLGQPVQWRRWVWFNVDYRYTPSDVIGTVEEVLRGAPIANVAAAPAPNCILMEFHESYGRYAVRYWLTDLSVDDPTDSEVRTRVYFALKRAGIPLSIPAHALFLTHESDERRVLKDRAERERRLEALRRVELFDPLPREDHERMAEGLRHAPFTRGEVMTRQGAEAHWLYMILRGDAAVRIATDDGLEKEVAQLHAGDFFGEMSLMTGAPRSATVVALTDVECYRLEKATFQAIVRDRPELAEAVAGILARRRTELASVKEGLDAEARERQLAEAKGALLGRIREFFGLPGGKGISRFPPA